MTKQIKKFAVTLIMAVTIFVGAGLSGLSTSAEASKGDIGLDWSVYQGASGKYGYGHEKFAVSQIGGTTSGWNLYDQWTYPYQIANGRASGLKMHTYIWWQNVTTNSQADYVLNYFLPKIQAPKGSIVALDVESGYQNTNAIAHAVQRIKDAGYTPMVYGYKNYLVNNTNLQYLSTLCQLWLAEYPNYNVTTQPNYNFFPSFNNIGVFQFTSTYVAGGLDANIDLTGITDNGYGGNAQQPVQKPAQPQPAIKANSDGTYTVKSGDTLGVIASAFGTTYQNLAKLNNISNPNVISVGQVLKVKGNAPVASKPKEIKPAQTTQTYTVKYGDTLGTIAQRYGTTYQAIASLNGISNPNRIYVGQRLTIKGGSATTQSRVHVVSWGESLGTIAQRYGTTYQAIAQKNGIANPNLIYVGQRLSI